MDHAIPKYLITGDLFVKPTYEFIEIMRKPFNFDAIEAHKAKKLAWP